MIRRGSVDVESNRLVYTTNRAVPKGIPIVLVHGLGGAASDFEQAFLHPELSRRCLIAPDLLGFGDSDKSETFSYDLADQADLLDAFLGSLDCPQVELVGHSMGGLVGILLALRHPDRVRRLIVAEPNLDSENARISRMICGYGSVAVIQAGYEAFIGQYDRPDRPSAYRFHQTLQKTTPAILFRSSRSVLLHAEGGLYLDFLMMKLSRDYLMGEKSWHVVTPRMLRDFEEADIGYHVLSGAGHAMMGDDPQAFCDRIESILSCTFPNGNKKGTEKMDNRLQIREMVAKAQVAQKTFEGFDQRQVDAAVREIARVVFDQAESLARLAVDETRMGVYEDKVKKNQGKARILWNHLRDKPSVGILRRDAATGVVEIAKPMGIVGAVTPCTNPIVTPMCNAMFALKCRNAIILAPHPRARRCAERVTQLFRDAIEALGAPADLVQVLREPSVELTGELMKAVDVVIATGGMGMVRAAYSSGKPAYGVGTGNVQCILDKGYDPKIAIPKIVAGRIFDNGIICSGEQTLFLHRDDFAAALAVLEAEGAFLVSKADDKERLRRTLFDNGAANKDATGQSALRIAELCGFEVPAGTRLLVCEADGPGAADILCKEKMCPVLTLMRYDKFEQAMDLALEGLEVDGKGHSISIHSDDEARIEYAAGRAPVSRVLVNQICATMNGGSFFNGFTPTTTLGCGSWGGNSISENLDYRHLMNITRIGHYMKDAVVPTDDALWG